MKNRINRIHLDNFGNSIFKINYNNISKVTTTEDQNLTFHFDNVTNILKVIGNHTAVYVFYR
jgi:hypothetical protein